MALHTIKPMHCGKVLASPLVRTKVYQKPDSVVLQEMHDWMTSTLPCVAGRREVNRKRYMVRLATRDTVASIFREYQSEIAAGNTVACFFVFNNAQYYEGGASVSKAFHFLAHQMEPISGVSSSYLANGAALTNSMELYCPVTNLKTVFDDFECIAFCPQSNDKDDPLYDPLLATPYTGVNLSSDVYAFSRFVSDSTQTFLGHPAWEEKDINKLEKLFNICVERWQRVAVTTINNYETLTDTSLCPVHVTKDQKHWIAGHKDPAFAEQIKEVHKHELPVLYAKRMTAGWLDYFRDGRVYTASGMARDGLPA